MKSCAQCQQQNQEGAKFCYQCGNTLAIEPTPPIAAAATHTDEDLWRQFVGPHADRYLEHFKKFGLG
ncbi:MAG: zinc ribbon domain-containing protein, partial [Nitrospiraceae bacterium]